MTESILAPKVVLAIDPGRTGGFALWNGEEITLHAMPENEYRTRALIDKLTPQGGTMGAQTARAVIEHVGSLGPGDPLKGQRLFNFGRGYGFLRGILAERQVPYEQYRPQLWQKPYGITSKGADRKRELKEKALELYPDLAKSITLKTCDALLLLHFELTKSNITK